MTRQNLIEAWLEGACIATLAKLLDEDPLGIEAGIRHELLQIRAEQQDAAPKTNGAPKPATMRQHIAADIDRQKAKRASKIDRLGKIANGQLLDDYPEPLRHPLAVNQRAVWDALRAPAAMGDIELDTGVENGALYQTLMTMRNKALIHKRDSDGKWERCQES